MNTSFYSLWFDPTGNRTRVYCTSNRRFIHSTTDRFKSAKCCVCNTEKHKILSRFSLSVFQAVLSQNIKKRFYYLFDQNMMSKKGDIMEAFQDGSEKASFLREMKNVRNCMKNTAITGNSKSAVY